MALSEGELVRGVFRASARDPSTGVVKASEGAKTSLADILIEGRACAGQALDGDVVAVEIAEGGGEREEDSGEGLLCKQGWAVGGELCCCSVLVCGAGWCVSMDTPCAM